MAILGGASHPEVLFWERICWRCLAIYPEIHKSKYEGHLCIPYQLLSSAQFSGGSQRHKYEHSWHRLPLLHARNCKLSKASLFLSHYVGENWGTKWTQSFLKTPGEDVVRSGLGSKAWDLSFLFSLEFNKRWCSVSENLQEEREQLLFCGSSGLQQWGEMSVADFIQPERSLRTRPCPGYFAYLLCFWDLCSIPGWWEEPLHPVWMWWTSHSSLGPWMAEQR